VAPTVLADIAPLLVDVLELAQGLDDVDVLARPRDDQLGALVQAVVEHLEGLEHVAPILALVVQALIEHVHDLVEVGRAGAAVSAASAADAGACALLIEGDLGDLGHVGTHGAPWVVARRCQSQHAPPLRHVFRAHHCGPSLQRPSSPS